MSHPKLPVYDPHKVRGTRRTQRTAREITLDHLKKTHDGLLKRIEGLEAEKRRREAEIEALRRRFLEDLVHSRD